jgi:hypothetical protein
MLDIFYDLTEKERKQLRLLGLLFLLGLVFFVFGSLRERRAYLRLAGQLASQRGAYSEADKARAAAGREWARWEEADKNLAELKSRYFYQETDGINGFSLDLQKIFAEAGITPRSLKFDYADLEKAKSQKVNVTFNFTGSYTVLKRFLGIVERFPKFLFLERLDFLRITGEGSALELRVILAGYFENF